MFTELSIFYSFTKTFYFFCIFSVFSIWVIICDSLPKNAENFMRPKSGANWFLSSKLLVLKWIMHTDRYRTIPNMVGSIPTGRNFFSIFFVYFYSLVLRDFLHLKYKSIRWSNFILFAISMFLEQVFYML